MLEVTAGRASTAAAAAVFVGTVVAAASAASSLRLAPCSLSRNACGRKRMLPVGLELLLGS